MKSTSAPWLHRNQTLSPQLLTALILGFSFGAYFVLRYLGLWTEQDTEVFIRVITDMQAFGSLQSPGAYTHGYAYPVWATTLANLTGLQVADLLQLYTPMFGNVLLALSGYVFFRRLLASQRLGLSATIILFLVPELVFTVSRGNHEKLTVALTLFALCALLNSFLSWQRGDRRSTFFAWGLSYYLSAFTLATLNIFFGSVMIVALSVMLLFAALIVVLRPRAGASLRPVVGRLARVVSITWLLVLLVMWYVYPQTSGTHEILRETARERLSVLFFPETATAEDTFEVSDPYAVGALDWASLDAYRLVSLFRWTLFLCSFPTWLVLLVLAWRRLENVSLERFFLLGLYGALGLVLALAVPIDFLNLSAGTNLQVRMYTYFALLAAPMLALGLGSLTQLGSPSRAPKILVTGLVTLGFGFFAVLSLFKATLDPTLSNRWLFYHPAEVQAARFWDQRHDHNSLWLDVEGRLRYAYITTYPEAYPKGVPDDNLYDFGPFSGRDAFALRSSLLEKTAVAWQLRPSPLWLEDRPYDNGEAQIYHRIPRTPFQQ